MLPLAYIYLTVTGFGEEGFDPKWPNGARIAVSFVLNYEFVYGSRNNPPLC